MELKGSLPCSQEPTTGPFHESDESSPHLHAISYDFLNNTLLSIPKSLKWSLPFKSPPPKLCMYFLYLPIKKQIFQH